MRARDGETARSLDIRVEVESVGADGDDDDATTTRRRGDRGRAISISADSPTTPPARSRSRPSRRPPTPSAGATWSSPTIRRSCPTCCPGSSRSSCPDGRRSSRHRRRSSASRRSSACSTARSCCSRAGCGCSRPTRDSCGDRAGASPAARSGGPWNLRTAGAVRGPCEPSSPPRSCRLVAACATVRRRPAHVGAVGTLRRHRPRRLGLGAPAGLACRHGRDATTPAEIADRDRRWPFCGRRAGSPRPVHRRSTPRSEAAVRRRLIEDWHRRASSPASRPSIEGDPIADHLAATVPGWCASSCWSTRPRHRFGEQGRARPGRPVAGSPRPAPTVFGVADATTGVARSRADQLGRARRRSSRWRRRAHGGPAHR